MGLALRWRRHALSLVFLALALTTGLAVGLGSELISGLHAPADSRPTFYLELFFAVIGAFVAVAFALTRSDVALPLFVLLLAFLPSRTGMQWRYAGYAILSVTDLVILLALAVLLLRTKVRTRTRLQPIVVGASLRVWFVVGILGLILALDHGTPWVNWVASIKGFYYWILIVVLCVNVVRTPTMLRAVMAVLVLSSLPTVFSAVHDAVTGAANVAALLPNGTLIYRTTGGSGLVNQYAFYVMAVFFVALGLTLTARRWSERLLFFTCTVGCLVAVYLTYTRGAWIATIIGLAAFALVNGRKTIVGLIATAIACVAVAPPALWGRLSFGDSSVAERIDYAHTAFAAIHVYPLTGYGWGSTFETVGQLVVPMLKPADLPFWHNDYLIVATQVGLPGLAVFLWIWAALAWNTIKTARSTPTGFSRTTMAVLLGATAAMFAQAFTDMFYWRNETGPLVWLIVGLLCATINMARASAAAQTVSPHGEQALAAAGAAT